EGGRFREATARFGLAGAHGKTWGVAFGDMNNDGWPDLYLANDEVPCDLYRNRRGRFAEIGLESGTAYSRDGVRQGGMGADWGDFDNDGAFDLLGVDASGGPLLLHNDAGRTQHWLTVRVLNTNGRSDAIGARVEMTAGGRRQIAEVNPGGSYFAINDPRVHFGL